MTPLHALLLLSFALRALTLTAPPVEPATEPAALPVDVHASPRDADAALTDPPASDDDNILLQAPDWRDLPSRTLFPGPWTRHILAAPDKAHIRPARVLSAHGTVLRTHDVLGSDGTQWDDDAGDAEAVEDVRDEHRAMMLGPGGRVTFEFAQNIGGRVCFNVSHLDKDPVLALTFSESPFYAEQGDATTDRRERDLPLLLPLTRTGTTCVGPQYVRGGFKYLTIHLPHAHHPGGFWHDGRLRKADLLGWLAAYGQQTFGRHRNRHSPAVHISALWVRCSASPAARNWRAYTGYFHSSSPLLNRIWYAGAYTLQLGTIDPREGSALIDYNRVVDRNQSPTGAWYSNFSVADGASVTTDGAKRDRVAWPGDLNVAAPAIAVSTYDLASVKNALRVLFRHQYADGSLPYSGPPGGFRGEFSDTYHLHTLLAVHSYLLYSGDDAFVRELWPAYLRALDVSLAKVDGTGLMLVTSTADWLRPGMSGHNLEASALLFSVLSKSIELVRFLGLDLDQAAPLGLWQQIQFTLRQGIQKMDCEPSGLYADNLEERNCGLRDEVLPQDGNSWALLSGMIANPVRAAQVSDALQRRWTQHGAPAVEFPNVISPFISSFELQAHAAAGHVDAAVELMLREWGHLLHGPGFTNSTLAEGFRVDGHMQYPAYWSPARNSHAHGWSAGPTFTLAHDVLGIHLLAPLGRRWAIAPRCTRWLRAVQGGFATRLGTFEVKLKQLREAPRAVAGRARPRRAAECLEIVTPPGTRGEVRWGAQAAQMRGGGRRRWCRWVADDADTAWIPVLDAGARDSADALDAARREWAATGEAALRLEVDEEWAMPALEPCAVGRVDWTQMPAAPGADGGCATGGGLGHAFARLGSWLRWW